MKIFKKIILIFNIYFVWSNGAIIRNASVKLILEHYIYGNNGIAYDLLKKELTNFIIFSKLT